MSEPKTEILGKDVSWNLNGFSVSASGDYVLCEGDEAFRQAVLRRLVTAPGEFATRPTYGAGVTSYVNERRTPTMLANLKRRVIDQMSLDPRTDGTRVECIAITGGVRVEVSVKSRGEMMRFIPFDFTDFRTQTTDGRRS